MQGQIFFHETVENSNFPVFAFNARPPATWSGTSIPRANSTLTRSTEYARKGSYSCKITLTNAFSNDLFQLKRELNWNYVPAGAYLPGMGVDNRNRSPIGHKWTAVSILIPSYNNDFNTITSIAFNTKEVNDDYPTTSYLAMNQGRYILVLTPVSSSNVHQQTPTVIDVGPVIKDQWEDWILDRNYTNQDSGYVRLYKNGQLVASRNGGNWKIGPTYHPEAYMNMGIYKWVYGPSNNPAPNVNTVTVFYDEFKFAGYGTTLEQMLVDPPTNPNQSPTVIINTPNPTMSSNINLTAVGNDNDGNIVSYLWTQQSGPNTATLSNQNTANLSVSNMIDGTYTFRCTVTDDDGATGFAQVSVVKTSNTDPSITVGSGGFYVNQTSVQANIEATDIEDGTDLTYEWTQVSGPAFKCDNLNVKNPTFYDLRSGNYVFQVYVRDQDGGLAIGTLEFKVRIRITQIKFKKVKVASKL